MIKNLPDSLPIAALVSFEFGEVEAKEDPLLSHCPVPIRPLVELLSNKKDIVLGARGTGKSATVRLLSDQKLRFASEEGWRSLILVLDEEFDYRGIREHLERRAESESNRQLACRVVWEILIVFRALQTIEASFSDCDDSIREPLKELKNLLGVTEKRPSLFEVILSHKKKIGIKLDSNLPNVIDMYTSLEPSLESRSQDLEVSSVKIVEIRRDINNFLTLHKTAMYVLFDRLDDFVAGEEHATQRQLLQGLLATQTDYRQKYPSIRIKSFFRSDLFSKLNLSEFGADKIHARCVELKWTTSELKHLLAKRVAYNLMRALARNQLEIEVEADKHFLSQEELERVTVPDLKLHKLPLFSKSFWSLARVKLMAIWRRRSSSSSDRLQNSIDIVNDSIIYVVFPRRVAIPGPGSDELVLSLKDFLQDYLLFSHGNATPRIVLGFANKCISQARDYYSQNRDLRKIEKTDRSEYSLIGPRAAGSAFLELQEEAWKVQFSFAPMWEAEVALLQRLAKEGFRFFSFRDFVAKSELSEEDARQCLAFLGHTGLLSCKGEHEKLERRSYEFPRLFQAT